jgi:ParB family chromosome partitioning protein
MGQIQPVRVRWDAAADRWVLIAGERRYRAAQRAGMTTLVATVETQSMSADRVLEFQLVENALRADLTPLESGAAYQQLMAVWNCTQQQLAARLHISQSKISRAIAALDLPADVQQAVESGKVGAVAAVKQVRRKPASSRRATKPKPVRIVTGIGTVIVTPKPGQSVVDVLLAAVEAERKRGAA